MERWPQSLLIAVGICLNSRFPMFVWWGEELINIYNDGYIPDARCAPSGRAWPPGARVVGGHLVRRRTAGRRS